MNTNTHKVTVGKVVQYLILILMFLLLVGPFVWELSLSFKARATTSTPCSLPDAEDPDAGQLHFRVQAGPGIPLHAQHAGGLPDLHLRQRGLLHDGRLRTGTPEVAWPRTGVHHVHGHHGHPDRRRDDLPVPDHSLHPPAEHTAGSRTAWPVRCHQHPAHDQRLQIHSNGTRRGGHGGRCQPMAAVLPHLCTAGQRHDDRCRHLRIRRCLERLPVAVDRDLR